MFPGKSRLELLLRSQVLLVFLDNTESDIYDTLSLNVLLLLKKFVPFSFSFSIGHIVNMTLTFLVPPFPSYDDQFITYNYY